jgi:uncharacterized protein
VISDTHLPRGKRELPAACVRRLAEADLILHAGDFVTVAVLEVLESYAPVAAVHGNVDEPALRSLLLTRRIVDAAGSRIGLVHDAGPASGRKERLTAAFPGCAAVVYGHTHTPQMVRAGGSWILNPGSPTERRRAPARAMLVVEAREGTLVPKLVRLAA